MINPDNALTVLCMASVTYLTRVAGFVAIKNRRLSPRAATMLKAAPGCVLISLIAPCLVSGEPAEMLTLALTVLVAMRCSMLPTVLMSMACAALLRAFLG